MNEILPDVKRVKNRLRDSAFDEPIYQLIYLLGTGKELTGHARWTLDELNSVKMRMA